MHCALESIDAIVLRPLLSLVVCGLGACGLLVCTPSSTMPARKKNVILVGHLIGAWQIN